MKLAFESDFLVPSISKAFSTLTDRARVCLNDIHYDEANEKVEILLQRNDITGFKKSFLGEMPPIYSQTKVSSLLRIRRVVGMNIKVDDRLVAECNSCFTVLFGIKMDANEIYLGSVEEVQGKTLCHVFITVKGMSIEIVDI